MISYEPLIRDMRPPLPDAPRRDLIQMMKSILLTPTFLPQLTGNAVTVDRISRLLSLGGITIRIINLSETDERTAAESIRAFKPDLIHAFHAYKGGRAGLAIRESRAAPLITTMTGTDLYVDMETSERREDILRVLKHSERITVFNTQARSALLEQGIDRRKISVIHQSVLFSDTREMDYRKQLNINRKDAVFLLLGGIRKIKDFFYALPALEGARRRFPDIRLIIAGPIIEREEFETIRAWYAGKPWVTYIGEVPRAHIRSLLKNINVLLNTSSSESEANAVLEAMSMGRIIIARDIPGNASLLRATGVLFRNEGELQESIIRMLERRNEWGAIGERARQHVARAFSPAREQAGYLAAYKKCVTRTSLRGSIGIA